jgi:hypothetical protein
MNKAGQTAPELGERRWASVAKRFGVDEPPLHAVRQAPRQGTPAGTTPAGT